MKKLKVYIETSVWNFLITEQSPEKRGITEKFFAEVSEGRYEIFISDFVVDEISAAPEPRKTILESLIGKFQARHLPIIDELETLTKKYKEKNFIPEKFENDLLHISIAVLYNMDLLLSWNMKHIVKYRTRVAVNNINLVEGFKSIEILTPEEVIEDD